MVAPAPRVVAFCADDVGLVAGVADTVIALAAAGRLAAASCVSGGGVWHGEGHALAVATRGLTGFGLGLHFNLTEGTPLSPDLARLWPSFPGLATLIAKAHLGLLPVAALASEWRAQLDAFTDVVGKAPGHVDGHQHVHHLPQVREVVLTGIDGAAARQAVAVRNTGHVVGTPFAFKRCVIEATGGRALARELDRRGLRRNAALLGVYDFRAADYRALMRGWLADAPATGGLVFCHPCAAGAAANDPIAAARRREATYLSSAAFADDLAEAQFSVGAAWQSSSDD